MKWLHTNNDIKLFVNWVYCAAHFAGTLCIFLPLFSNIPGRFLPHARPPVPTLWKPDFSSPDSSLRRSSNAREQELPGLCVSWRFSNGALHAFHPPLLRQPRAAQVLFFPSLSLHISFFSFRPLFTSSPPCLRVTCFVVFCLGLERPGEPRNFFSSAIIPSLGAAVPGVYEKVFSSLR